MNPKAQYTKALTAMMALALFVTGCTKQRDAALPEDAQETIFSIDTFGTENAQYKVSTDDQMSQLSLGDSSKATAEKGLVQVANSDVPQRLKYMFKGLKINGQPNQNYSIVFSVDKQYVTAYKIVTTSKDMSILDKQLAQAPDEVQLQKQLQKTKDNSQAKTLMSKLQKARSQKMNLLSQSSFSLLVPIFKYKIAAYGILDRVSNELREKTSTLRLKSSDWSDATHIQISVNAADRLQVGLDPSATGSLDRTFVMDKVNNKLMSAETLSSEYQIPTNLDAKTRVLTLLDTDALHVFEVGQIGKTTLTDSQMSQLSAGAKNSNVRKCSDEIVKALPAESQANCILVLRYDVPVSYVRPELPTIDLDGNQSNSLQFKQVRAADSVGLVQIAQNVEPRKIEANNQMDPRTTIRVADIKDREFFFKRTLEDAPVTTTFAPGMAGSLTIVKFELQESRLVVRKADKLVEFKTGSNDTDVEELMSIPVRYWKTDLKDASGAQYAMARMVPASRQDAEYVEFDWTKNTLSTNESPYASISEGCVSGLADQQVTDLDMKMDKGALSFSYQYSVSLAPSLQCLGLYSSANDYNGLPKYQTTARMKERVSFKLNDGSTDASFVGQIPFQAQNAMGYGVWTLGKMNPTQEGLHGRNGTEVNYNVVQDFRNGRIVMYTLTGLPTDEPEVRQLYIDTAREVVDAWDLAYHKVFKGSKWERSGRYVDMQIAGENGVSGHVGDIDKNIIHFENKINDNHGILGVSQVGFNPRSGIVVADSVIVYAGNLKSFVARFQRNSEIAQSWADTKKTLREQVLAQAEAQQKEEKAASEAVNQGKADSKQQAEAASVVAKKLASMVKGKALNKDVIKTVKDLNLTSRQLKEVTQLRKSLGDTGASFNYQSPTAEYGWIDRVLKKLKDTPDLYEVDLDGLVAKEMLASIGKKLSEVDRAELQRKASLGEIRTKMRSQFKSTPGCMLEGREALVRSFTGKTFMQALRSTLFFDLGHEMGHSQGLTHNFIGSFDKANFANEDGTSSERNYSSIMDYFNPSLFQWDGIGSYDIHALRASHLGLLEVSAEAKKQFTEHPEQVTLVDGKYMSIEDIRKAFASKKNTVNGQVEFTTDWTNFTANSIGGLLKPYMYCTDIHVGYTPTCQRFDYGTSATEIVENLVKDYESNYVNNYYSWDRSKFGWSEASGAITSTMMTMFNMRQFLDELFYMGVTQSGSKEQMQDYGQAVLKAFAFYNQVLRTPDMSVSFMNQARFKAVNYKYQEYDKEGKATGKEISDWEIVEKRPIQTISTSQYRVDTVGIEQDKIFAMNFLTMKTFPSSKYYSQNINFSFLDFEKYFLGLTTDKSVFVNTITGLMLDNLESTFTNEHAILQGIPGEKSTVTAGMRAYAGMFSILNLEAMTLRDKDNFANLFKVGMSVGKAPSDRISLSQLGAADKSSTRVSYWAIDNASAANSILKAAAVKSFFIKSSDTMQPLMEKLFLAQFQGLISGDKTNPALDAAKKDLIANLNALNKNGEIVSEATLKAAPQFSIESQVEQITLFNQATISLAFGILKGDDVDAPAADFKAQLSAISDVLPLFAVNQAAVVSATAKIVKTLGEKPEFKAIKEMNAAVGMLMNAQILDVSYGIIMKNIDFLSKLTIMTNPELNR